MAGLLFLNKHYPLTLPPLLGKGASIWKNQISQRLFKAIGQNRCFVRVALAVIPLQEVKSTLQRPRRTEKKQKMKESTPPPLKERKEIRKEDCLNNYNNKKEDSTKTTKDNLLEQLFIPPTPAEE